MWRFTKVSILASFTLLLVAISFALTSQSNVSAQTTDNVSIRIRRVSPSCDSETIEWTTSPATKCNVECIDKDGKKTEIPPNKSYTEEHSVTLLNLLSKNDYLYRLTCVDENGHQKVHTDTFSTLGDTVCEKKVTPTPTPFDDGGFLALLSPSPSITPSPTPAYPWALPGGQYVPFYPIPIPIAYQPQVLGAQITQPPTPTPIPPTNTPIPTQQPSAVSISDTGSLILIIGLLAGIIISFMVYELRKDQSREVLQKLKNKAQKNEKSEANSEDTTQSDTQTFKFSVKPKDVK